MMRHANQVVCVLLRPKRRRVDEKPSVFLAQRLDRTRPYYLMFAPPGGKVDPVGDAEQGAGNILKQGALRELREETGLVLTSDRLIYVTEMDSITSLADLGTNIPFRVYWFGADLNFDEEPRQTEPHKQGVWIPWTLQGIQSIQLPPGDREAITQFLRAP